MMVGGMLIGVVVLPLFLLLVAGLVVAAVLLARQGWGLDLGGPPGPPAREEEDPLEILRRRYARGEIDREEYERMRDDLRQ